YFHYYRRFYVNDLLDENPEGFFGGSWNTMEDLMEVGDLYHVFLGPMKNPDDDNFCIVPNGDLMSDKFVLTEETQDNSWKFGVHRDSNAKHLFEYNGLDVLFDK
ncbi:MAG: hypothetical protein SXQ77_10395, partial [Halobacteria archaeon]|nr:hypothetical protein [Halobacteria archaeon]